MKKRLIIILSLMVLCPLGLAGWLAWRSIDAERNRARLRALDRARERLETAEQRLTAFFQTLDREMIVQTMAPSYTPDALRERTWNSGLIRQIFTLDGEGRLRFPSPAEPMSADEAEFIERATDLWGAGELIHAAHGNERRENAEPIGGAQTSRRGAPDEFDSQNAPPPPYQPPSAAAREPVPQQIEPPTGSRLFQRQQPPSAQTTRNQTTSNFSISNRVSDQEYGWFVWYYGAGLNLIFWRWENPDLLIGAELESARLIADIIGALPDTGPRQKDFQIRLVNAQGETIYQWGNYEPAEDVTPLASHTPRAPLFSWRLDYYADPLLLVGGSSMTTRYSVFTTLAALTLVLILMAVYFFRESGRELREAGRKVNFVNQVSHELKTPLTNIRMYAEMIQDNLEEDDTASARHVQVIATESQRLSRLIGNILNFSREQRGALTLRTAQGDLDETVHRVLERFAPSLEEKEIRVSASLNAGERVYDADAVEQILGNLINNVEKYAAEGKTLIVSTEVKDGVVRIVVEDRGKGIARSKAERVFEPFVRLDTRLSAGASGAGIGLSIARRLARLHGGDLKLEPSQQGARFVLTLAVAETVD